MTAAPKPLPCPFCGAGLLHDSDSRFEWWSHPRPLARECFIPSTLTITPGDLDRWNRRAPEQPA